MYFINEVNQDQNWVLKSENSFAILVEPSDEETNLNIEVWYEET